MRHLLFLIFLTLILVGCADSTPVLPGTSSNNSLRLSERIPDPSDLNRKLWAYGLIHVNDDHTRFDWVPLRAADMHLNALNLLENGPCYNCISIKSVVPQGNGIVDVDIGIYHPFPGMLQYTGFDVKGIVMFDGSFEARADSYSDLFWFHPELDPLRYNLAILGDWELLNEDGFTLRWSPTYISGEDLPIFNYVEGRFSSGFPNSLVNAYKAFYTHEDRWMFLPGNEDVRTYRIQTQPGPATLGYAVEACWKPPDVMPVTNPAFDFPVSANQSEPYIERYFLNDDRPITAPHTEIFEYQVFCQFREWPAPNKNDSFCYGNPPNALIGDEWDCHTHTVHGKVKWLYGPQSGTEDIYAVGTPSPWGTVWDTFSPFGKFNGYYVWLRFSYRSSGYFGINFNPHIQIVQIDIPGNDPPG